MRRIHEQIIALAGLLLVLSGMYLRSAAKVAIAMGVLWLIGTLFPDVADALGLPHLTVYDALVGLIECIRALIREAP